MFIPVDKIKKLREDAKNGNENARKILDMQLGGNNDFGSLLDDYFKPVVQETSTEEINEDAGLNEFLKFNGVDKNHPEYQSYVDDYYKENPKVENNYCVLDKLMKEEMDAIRSYNDAILEIMNCDKYSDNEKKGIISRLEEIKRDEQEHYEELGRLNKKDKETME